MRRHVDCQDWNSQVGKVEVERATADTRDWQRCHDDAADRIQKLAGHEHEHDNHQCLGHVVLCLGLLGHVLTTGRVVRLDVNHLGHDLTTKVELAEGSDETVGHGGVSWVVIAV